MAIPNPEFVFVEQSNFDVIQSDGNFGPVLRGAKHPNKIRRFRLQWSAATLSEKDDLVSEISTAKGSAGTLSYTPTDEASPITVRFVEDSFRWTWLAPNRVSMTVQFEEVLFS